MPQNSEGPQQNQPPQNSESGQNQQSSPETQSSSAENQSPLQRLLPRREFVVKAGAAAAILLGGPLLSEFVRAQGSLNNEKQAYEDGKKSPEVFLAENKELLKNVSLGTTFVPEDFRDNKELGIRGLQWMHDTLGMKHLRVAIRQDTVPDITNPNPDLSYYKDFFAEMRRLGFTLTLCIGAKTPVYPESHIDAKTQNANPQLKDTNAVVPVKPDTKLGQTLLAETYRLATAFTHQFPEMADMVDAIQPSNEPFYVEGKPKLDISPEYLRQEVDALARIFPGKQILLNHFGVVDLQHLLAGTQLTRAVDFALDLQKAGLPVRLGYDYYYYTDNTSSVEGILPDSIAITEAIALRNNVFEWYKAIAQANHIPLEATELAWEHWGKHNEPEVDVQQFQGQLLRVARNVIDPTQPSRVLLWGSTSQIRDRFTINADGSIAENPLSPSQETMYKEIAAVNTIAA